MAEQEKKKVEEKQSIDIKPLQDSQKEVKESVEGLNDSFQQYFQYVQEKDIAEEKALEEKQQKLAEEQKENTEEQKIETEQIQQEKTEQQQYQENVLLSLNGIKEEIVLMKDNTETELQTIKENAINHNVNNVEGFWLLSFVLVFAIAFKMFFDNTMKW